MQKTIQNGLSSQQQVEGLFTRKGIDALLPQTMNKIFKSNIPEDFNIPSFMDKERLLRLHNEGIGLISFAPKTIKSVLDTFDNKTTEGKPMIIEMCLPEWEFWDSEVPRTGLCLMSLGVIRRSTGKTFYQQTKALEEYIDVYLPSLLPELINSKFWKQAKKEFWDQETKIKELMKKDISKEALEILCNLKINQMFRPKVSELVQQVIAYGQLQQTLPKYHSASNGCHGGIFWEVYNSATYSELGLDQLFSCSNSLFGTHFICNFDELLAVI